MPSLIIVGKKDGAELALDTAVTVIGRDRGVTLELSDFQVSRRHALVVRTDDGCFVKDLGSRNGVLVNSARVASRRHQRLKNGDVLQLGRTAFIYKDVTGAPLEAADVATIAARPAPAPEKAARPQAAGPAPAAPKPAIAESSATPAPPGTPLAALPAPRLELASPPPQPPRPRFVELAADADGDSAALGTRDDAAVRALLRRLEHERVFYRNLALALVSFLMVLVIVLLVFALRRHEKTETGKANVASPAPERRVAQAPTGGSASALVRPQAPVSIALGRAGELDAREFADTVEPLLAKTCATGGCHASPATGAGELALALGGDEATVAKNLACVRRFVVPGRPERSALLTKPLRRDEGGEGHGGGDVLAAESPAYQAIRAWIARAAPPPGDERAPARAGRGSEALIGADLAPPATVAEGPRPTTHKPLARIAPTASPPAVGATVLLDGRASVCPVANCPLRFRWTVDARPEGSRVEVSALEPGLARVVPDLPGRYAVSLVVSDADGTSDPTRIELAVAASAPPPIARAPLRADPQGRAYVREVFVDLLGRSPTLEESEQALGRTREELVADLFARHELYSDWYEETLLDLGLTDECRPPSEMAEIAGHLERRENTVLDALAALATSPSFAQRHASADDFVATIAEKLLGTDASALADGKKMVDGASAALFGKTGKSAADLVRIVLGQRSALAELARRAHARVTGLAIAPDELERAVARLADAGADGNQPPAAAFFDVEREWVLSAPYIERVPLLRPKSERAFVRTLFQDVLGRTPDEEELRATRRALGSLRDPGPLHAALAKVLLDSPQARIPTGGSDEAFVTALFERLLAREPSPAELATFTSALGSGTARATVVRALVSSAEYDCY